MKANNHYYHFFLNDESIDFIIIRSTQNINDNIWNYLHNYTDLTLYYSDEEISKIYYGTVCIYADNDNPIEIKDVKRHYRDVLTGFIFEDYFENIVDLETKGKFDGNNDPVFKKWFYSWDNF